VAATAILDGLITSDATADLDAAYVRELVALTRDAGALWIADEVQAGLGRTGEAMWAFARFDVIPDFVTLGKPMGNGHPVAAVVTRREIVAALAGHTTLFSTFGGRSAGCIRGGGRRTGRRTRRRRRPRSAAAAPGSARRRGRTS
jgi:4-aminobutyrate aminotransferase-like enzyme